MKKLIFSLTVAVALLSGCAKDGETGPAGKDGNANVTSTTFTITNWTYSAPYFYDDLPVPAITQSIVDNGAVLVYIMDSGYNIQLPVTIYPTASYSQSWGMNFGLGVCEITVNDSDQTQPINPGTKTVKVVVIASRSMLNDHTVNWNSYESVEQHFNLK